MSETTDLPPGHRRLDVQIHSTEDVLGYVEAANQIMLQTGTPQDEQKELRVMLVSILAARNTQLVPVVSEIATAPAMAIPRGAPRR
jgi:hypothetical protein